MGENNESTADFAAPPSNESNKPVNKLSVKNVRNNEIDSTDSIECDSMIPMGIHRSHRFSAGGFPWVFIGITSCSICLPDSVYCDFLWAP